MNKKIMLIGMGGHSKVVADIAKKNDYQIIGYLDDLKPVSPRIDHLGAVTEIERFLELDAEFFIAIGRNDVRQKIAEQLEESGARFATLIDPSAVLGSGVEVKPGTVVMPGVIVNADARVGKHAILNTGATIDHDCIIGEYAHISPGAHLAGGVRVGALAHVGLGANIIQQIEIGMGSIVGAGAVVIRNVEPYQVAVGVPAKAIQAAP